VDGSLAAKVSCGCLETYYGESARSHLTEARESVHISLQSGGCMTVPPKSRHIVGAETAHESDLGNFPHASTDQFDLGRLWNSLTKRRYGLRLRG
jgi:hypothetical protein